MKESYRQFKAWEEAISLSLLVHSLIEALPSEEQSALATSLNAAAVNIPTIIALNLTQMQVPEIRDVVSLQTQLELIDRIYPALDTAEVAEAARTLLGRLQEPARFRETLAHEPQDEVEEADEDMAEEIEGAAKTTKVDIES